MNLVKRVIARYKSRKDMIKFARSIGVKVGKNCKIMTTVNFDSEPYLITIGDNCFITNGVRFCTHDGGAWVIRNLTGLKEGGLYNTITVGNNVYIGNFATLMPGVTVGDNSVIGYGSIVTKDVPSGEVWAGVPARKIESIEEYISKNKERLIQLPHDYEKKKNILIKKLYNDYK